MAFVGFLSVTHYLSVFLRYLLFGEKAKVQAVMITCGMNPFEPFLRHRWDLGFL